MSGAVVYHNHVVTDPEVRRILQNVANTSRRAVNVTSGDRNFVPHGGARHSDHLTHHAADFHIAGMSDDASFAFMQTNRQAIFGNGMTFQVIHHGPHTVTQGEHIHLGDPVTDRSRAGFWTEGLAVSARGHYTRVPQ